MEPSDEEVVKLAQEISEEQWSFLDDVWYSGSVLFYPGYESLIDTGIIAINSHWISYLTALGSRVYAWRDVFYV